MVFNRPEHVKEIFAGDPEVFHAGKGNAILGPVMGEHSLLLVDSAQHKRARRLLMPAFNGHALRGYEDMVTGLAKTEVGHWREGEPFASLERMNALTLEVILQVVFGVTDEARLGELRPLVNKTVNIPPLVFLGWGFPKLQKYGPWRRTIENQVELDRVIFGVIADRRAATDLDERTDVLSRLLLVRDENGEGLTDEELRDQLVTLLLAGHETTATALAWTLHELGKDAAQERKARDAASAGNTEYLEAVLKESMRLHPVIPMVVRHLMAPATIGGIDLPRGANVAASIILAHESEESHPDHTRFRPERFLEGEVAINTWIPFGGGVRRCIGAGFSLMEGVAVLREVLSTYDVELPPGTRRWPRSATSPASRATVPGSSYAAAASVILLRRLPREARTQARPGPARRRGLERRDLRPVHPGAVHHRGGPPDGVLRGARRPDRGQPGDRLRPRSVGAQGAAR